jgi:hypothetical protein
MWDVIFKQVRCGGYEVCQKIAIKVSFNDRWRSGNDFDNRINQIDALPQPILPLLSGMVALGV